MAWWKATLMSVVAASAVVASGCATQVVEPTPRAIDHLRGATDVVLRMSVGGGLTYPGYTMQSPPTFTLYGDGRVMYAGSMSTDTVTSVEIRQARMSGQQIDELLVGALEQGGLASAGGYYSGGPFADDVTTTFEIHAAGIDKVAPCTG